MYRTRQMLANLALGLLAASGATGAFTDWSYRRPIALSSATVTNGYQVRVDLTTNTFNYASCDAAGNDLRFEDPTSLQSLPYWIQAWTNAGPGTSTIWVAVANTGTTNFWIYYGKGGAPAASSGTGTFDFFDDFNSGSLSKWVARVSNGVITATNGYVEIGGGSTGGNYGHTALATALYTNFANAILEGSAFLSASAIAEVGWRDIAPNSGYKSRMDGRTTGGGISHLKPPYATWTQFDSQTATPVGTLSWKPFRITVNGSSMTIAVEAQSRTSTDAAYAGPGEISLQNHYGSYARYDDIRVRKYVATAPTATVGAEQLVPSGLPVVSNGAGATNVTLSAAWLNGVLVSTGLSATDWGVLWGTNNPGMTKDGWLGGGAIDLGPAGSANLTNTTQITGLPVNQTYYYAYWATNASGTNVAPPTPFTTQGAPTVDNGAGALATAFGTATLNGDLASDGGLPTEVYVCWGADTNSWANTNYLGFRGIGAFATVATNLYYGVPYYYRTYATNSYTGQWARSATNFLALSPTTARSWPPGWQTNAWTGDADSGISSAYTYLVAVNPDALAGTPTINGVTFGNGKSGPNYTISGIASDHGPDPNNVGGNSFDLAKYFSYGGNPGTILVTNLIVGKRYLITFYSFGWTMDTGPGARYQTFAQVGGASCYADQDFYGLDNGIRISCSFDAIAPSTTFTIMPASANTFHMSGLSVAQDPIVPGVLGITNTGATALAPGRATFTAAVQATGSVFDVWVYYGTTDGTNNTAAWGSSNLVATVTNVAAGSVGKTLAGLPAGTVWYTCRMVNAATNIWAAPSASVALPRAASPIFFY